MYIVLKNIHLLCVLLSFSGFIIRSIWAFKGSPLLQKKLVKVAPHIIDTILLVSAIAMAVSIQQYPFIDNCLTAKVFGLIAYIIFATITLKRARNNTERTACFILSILSFAYVVGVARTHSPLFFLNIV